MNINLRSPPTSIQIILFTHSLPQSATPLTIMKTWHVLSSRWRYSPHSRVLRLIFKVQVAPIAEIRLPIGHGTITIEIHEPCRLCYLYKQVTTTLNVVLGSNMNHVYSSN